MQVFVPLYQPIRLNNFWVTSFFFLDILCQTYSNICNNPSAFKLYKNVGWVNSLRRMHWKKKVEGGGETRRLIPIVIQTFIELPKSDSISSLMRGKISSDNISLTLVSSLWPELKKSVNTCRSETKQLLRFLYCTLC